MPQSLRRVSRAAAVMRLAATVLVVVVASTCVRDQSTAPALRTAPSGAVRGTYTTLGTYSIPIPLNNTDGGAQPVANTGIFVPAGTYYRVRVNGTVTVSDNPDYVQWYGTPFAEEGTYGPFGTSQGELVVQLKARFTDGSGTNTINFVNPQYNSGTSGPDSARSDVLYTSKAIEVQAGRSGIAGGANDNCCHWHIGMFALAASQTVTVEQATDVAHVVANPVAVHPNTQVTFTASRDDGGNLIVYNWHWQPDPGQPGNAGDLCGGGNPCLKTVAGSGTMTVYTNAGNPTAHVLVYQATNPDTSFRLVVDRSTAVIGDTVTFTPVYNGVPGPAARWRWAPSDTSTHDNAACGPGVSPCKKVMVTSGTMWAYTSPTAGQGDSASAAVTVTPRIDLSCAPRGPTRGQAVTCTASTPAGNLVITGLVFFASASLPGNGFVLDSITRSIDVDDNQWSGTMAASGIVVVRGTVNGTTARPGADTISIQNRTGWGWGNNKSAASEGPGSWECHTGRHYETDTTGWAVGSRCGNQDWIFSPYWPDTTGVHLAPRIPSGPNEGLWYLNSLDVALAMHAQVLKDLRVDGYTYAFTASSDSSTYSACTNAGVSSPATVTTVNNTCYANSDYQDFFNATWRHERCHMTVATTTFDTIPDARILAEHVVAADSIGAITWVQIQQNGLSDANEKITNASKALDFLAPTHYNLRYYSPQDSSWSLVGADSRNGIVSGC